MALIDKLKAIADGFRASRGLTEELTLDRMAELASEEVGGGWATVPYIEETYDANGELIDVNMVGYTKIRDCAFQNCFTLALTSLPEGLTSIGQHAFDSCTALALTTLPDGLMSIGNYSFNACSNLTSITFKSKPNTISSSAFNGCNNLETINVLWAEGEVAGAPWGATNATINYNYTEEVS